MPETLAVLIWAVEDGRTLVYKRRMYYPSKATAGESLPEAAIERGQTSVEDEEAKATHTKAGAHHLAFAESTYHVSVHGCLSCTLLPFEYNHSQVVKGYYYMTWEEGLALAGLHLVSQHGLFSEEKHTLKFMKEAWVHFLSPSVFEQYFASRGGQGSIDDLLVRKQPC